MPLLNGLSCKLIGDKGYISEKLFNKLYDKGLLLIMGIRKNRKNRLLLRIDKMLLKKRSILETVHDPLKPISQIEPTRHRSVTNFVGNVLSALAAYCFQPKKPSVNLQHIEFKQITDVA